jgi:hypothetical protein
LSRALLAPRPHSGQEIAIAGDDDSLLVNNELYQPIEFWPTQLFVAIAILLEVLCRALHARHDVRRSDKRHCHRDQARSGIRTPRRDAIHGLPDAELSASVGKPNTET